MNLGYKARALQSITSKGLPSLYWEVLDFKSYDFNKDSHAVIAERIVRVVREFGFWAIRTDAPDKNDGVILPLFGSNKGSDIKGTIDAVLKLGQDHPEYSFVLSEAPDDSTRDSNLVCWAGGDVLFGEIGFQPMTLRDAWVRGNLCAFAVDGSVGDFIRNRRLRESNMLSVLRVDYLRDIRGLLRGSDGFEYEISVTKAGRIIFWQESVLLEDRSSIETICLCQ